MNLSFFLQNRLIDGILRGGALGAGGAVNSTAVVTGIWSASTAYTAGQVVVPGPSMTGAGGKFLQCTTAGTTGSTASLAVPAVGATLADNTVTWTVVSGVPTALGLYVALLAINKSLRANSTAYVVGDAISLAPTGGAGGDNKQHLYRCTTAGTSAAAQPTTYLGVPGEAITDGTAVMTELSPVIQAGTGFPSGLTEVSGGSYARVNLAPTLVNWAGTQAAASTSASTGTTGTTSNNSIILFPAPTAAWASGSAAVGAFAVYDSLTGGNLLFFAPLTVPKTVNNGDAAPSFPAAALTFQIDN